MANKSLHWILICFFAMQCTPLREIRQTLNFSDQDEIEHALKAAAVLEAKKKLYENPAIQDYVDQIGQKIVAFAKGERPEITQYRFKVLDNPDLNAFTFGGGIIYVYSGLIARMENEAQLAGVLAHEIAHVTQSHVKEGVRAHGKLVVGLIIGSLLITPISTFDVTGLSDLTQVLLSYGAVAAASGHGRKQEASADSVALEYVVRAGYNPREFPRVFERFLEEYGDPPLVEHFLYGDHPTNRKRIAMTTREIQKKYASLDQSEIKPEVFMGQMYSLLLDVGIREYNRKRFKTAKALLERVVQFRENPDAYTYLGNIYWERPESPDAFVRAIEEYEKAISLDKDQALAYRGLGLVYYRMGEKQAAREALRKYLQLAPFAEDALRVGEVLEELQKQ